MGTSGLHALRLALKGLVRRPGYTVPMLLTLTLGIGANTATFTLLNSVVLRPLPYPDPGRIVRVVPVDASRGNATGAFSLPDVRDWEERATTLDAFGAYTTINSDLVYTAGEQAVEVATAYVTSGFFGAFATRPVIGRLPTVGEELGDNRVVVVSHAFWRQYLSADPEIVGRTIPLSGGEYRVAGVMPESFTFPSDRIEVWAFLTIIPASSTPYHIRGVRLLNAVGRISEGVSVEQARADLTSVASSLAAEYPDSNDRVTAAVVMPLQQDVVGEARTPLFVLMAAAALILLITWANLANLALAREAQRAPELAVRAALGASRLRRAGLVLVECLVLSVAAGLLGLLVASVGTDALVALGDSVIPRAHEITPDWRVAGFTLLVSLVTGATVAAMASAKAGSADLGDRLRATGRGAVKSRAKGFLVVSQVSLSVVLLIVASLLVKSLDALNRVDVGFEPDDLVVAVMTFASDRFPDRSDFLPRFDATLEALEAVPGVRSASSVRRFPFRGSGEGVRWRLPDASDDTEGTRVNLLQVSPGFFETMGVAFVDGGDFAPADVASGRPVAVVGRSVAAAAYSGERAVGRSLRIDGVDLQIVGVVEDIRQSDLRGDPTGVAYVPNSFWPRRGAAFILRAEPGAVGVLQGVRDAIQRLDSDQPITELARARDMVDQELGRDRFTTLLLVLFATLALVLCSVGVYAVVAFGVSRRRREVGIRLALGAEPAKVRALVVRQGLRPVIVGIVLGVALTVAASGALERLLFSVDGFEPVAYAGTVALLGVIGVVACWLPARGAAAGRAVEALAED